MKLAKKKTHNLLTLNFKTLKFSSLLLKTNTTPSWSYRFTKPNLNDIHIAKAILSVTVLQQQIIIPQPMQVSKDDIYSMTAERTPRYPTHFPPITSNSQCTKPQNLRNVIPKQGRKTERKILCQERKWNQNDVCLKLLKRIKWKSYTLKNKTQKNC